MWRLQVGSSITMVVGSCYAQVARVTTRLVQMLRANGWDEGRAQMVAVAAAELVNNIIEHALGNEAGHDILVSATCQDGQLELRVVDHGAPVPIDLIDRIRAPEVDPEDVQGLPEGGMGLFIARQIFHRLDWTNQDGQNVLLATARAA